MVSIQLEKQHFKAEYVSDMVIILLSVSAWTQVWREATEQEREKDKELSRSEEIRKLLMLYRVINFAVNKHSFPRIFQRIKPPLFTFKLSSLPCPLS